MKSNSHYQKQISNRERFAKISEKETQYLPFLQKGGGGKKNTKQNKKIRNQHNANKNVCINSLLISFAHPYLAIIYLIKSVRSDITDKNGRICL